MMPFSLFISLRYLKAKRKQTFISIISFISVAGVALGVAALIVVLAVMNGFDRDLRDKILGIRSHLQIGNRQGPFEGVESVLGVISSHPQVIAASPYLSEQVMLRTKRRASGCVLFGMDFTRLASITDIPKMVKQGAIPSPESAVQNKTGLILGVDLAGVLGVGVGDEVTVITPQFVDTPSGPIPRMSAIRVSAIFDAGMYEYNSSFAYMPLPLMQKLLDLPGKVHGVEVKVRDVYQARRVGRELTASLGPSFWSIDWISANRNLFSALALEKVVMFLILVIIVLVAAFNILSTLIMVVMEKTRDIGILKALGASTSQIMWVFMLEGLVIGVIGMVVGLSLGTGICWALGKYQFIKLPGEVYYITTLPVLMKAGDTLLIALSAFLLSFLATLYPAWQASRLDPVEAIRYE